MYVCMYACMHVCMYACMHVYVYIYILRRTFDPPMHKYIVYNAYHELCSDSETKLCI